MAEAAAVEAAPLPVPAVVEAAPMPAPAAAVVPAKKPKVSKAAGGKRRSSKKHPSFIKMIATAIETLKNTRGSSIPAIIAFIHANYDVSSLPERSLRTWIRISIRRGIASGQLRADTSHPNSFHATPKGRNFASKKSHKKKKPAKKVAKKVVDTADEKKEEKKEKKKAQAKKRAKKVVDDADKKEKKEKKQKKEKKEKKPARKKKDVVEAAAAAVPAEKELKEGAMVAAADVMMTGVAFNTTDIAEVRADVGSIIKTLLQDDNTSVGIVANRGMSGEPGKPYKLETLDFTAEREKINAFIEGSYGEGSDWLSYYRAVLDSALALPWALCKKKYLFLVGNNGTSVLTDRSLQDVTGRLEMLGVRVFGFHHTQLDLLQAVILADLH